MSHRVDPNHATVGTDKQLDLSTASVAGTSVIQCRRVREHRIHSRLANKTPNIRAGEARSQMASWGVTAFSSIELGSVLQSVLDALNWQKAKVWTQGLIVRLRRYNSPSWPSSQV